MSPEFSMAQNDCDPNCSPNQYTISSGSSTLGVPMAFGFNPGRIYMEFTNSTGTITEFCDGTAVISGDVTITNNPMAACVSGVFHVQWYLENAATYDEWTALGRDYKSRNCTDFEDFIYYELSHATLTGISDCNSEISISMVHRPDDIEFGFQIGNGAHNNGLNCDFSIGGWYTWTANSPATEALLGAATGPGDWHAHLSQPSPNKAACNDGDPNTKDDAYDANCVCKGNPIDGSGCNATYSVDGRTVTVSNLTGAIKAVKIYDMSWNTLYSCDDWGSEICDPTESFVVPSCGDYQIQTYADWSTPICNLFETFTVDSGCGGGVPVCKYYKVTNSTLNCSSHAGNEVVFLQKNCGGGPANYWTAGDNLQLKENGDGTATISGTILNGDETGVVHIDLSGFAQTGQHWQLACYDDNISPQYYYTSFNGTVSTGGQTFTIEPKTNGADFVFGNGANSEPNGAFSFGAWASGSWATCLEVFGSLQPLSHGDACDDGNDTTINDVIGADNCTCAGVPDVPPTDCDATIAINGKTITVNGLNGAIKAVKILDMSWNTLYSCDDWGGTTCGNSVSYTVDACGDYQVQIQTYADWSTPICNELETVTVDSDCGGGGPTDCDPGCSPTLYQITGGETRTGIPLAFGLNQIAVYFEYTNGTGTITELCDGTAVISGDVIVTNNPIAGCESGVYHIEWQLENAATYDEWTALGREYKSRDCNDFEDFTYYELKSARLYGISECNRDFAINFQHRPDDITFGFQIGNGAHNTGNDCDFSIGGWFSWTAENQATENALGQATGSGDWHAWLTPGTANENACDDGNLGTFDDTYDANCNCAGRPLPQPPGQTFDCPALGANIGDTCDDGNANTNNDVVNSNCNCAGTPIGTGTCDASYRIEGNKIIIEGLNAAINSAKILNNQWGIEAECSDWATACNGMLMATVPNGTYFVQIQTYADWSTPLCDVFEEVAVSGGGTGGCDNVTSGGSIAGDETGCGSYNPGPITSAALPSGGSGAIEYLWLSSTNGCPRYLTQAIDGANQSTYDPGTITQTTYYVRCSRRAGCDVWTAGESNCVVKTVDDDPNCSGGGACTIDISVSGNSITVTGAVGPFPNVGIYDDFGNVIYECHAFNGGCPATVTVNDLAPGVYWVSGRVIDSDWVTVLCEAFEDPVVGGGARVGDGNIKVETEKQIVAPADLAPDFKVYPNPASESVNVALNGYLGKDVTIQMIDYTGRPLKSIDIDNVETTSYTIPIDRMSNGIYTIRILSQGIKPIGKKMIVNRQF